MLYGQRSENLPGADTIATSPGFTWGKSGNVSSGAYLLNDSVPSNLAGRIVPAYNAQITQIFVTTETNDTATLAIETRSGVTFTEIGTISLSAERKKIVDVAISISWGDEIAVKVKTGSCKNPVLGLVIKGDSVA